MIKKEEQLEDVTKVEVKEEREEVDCPRERVSSSESSNLPNPTHFLSPPSAHLHLTFHSLLPSSTVLPDTNSCRSGLYGS